MPLTNYDPSNVTVIVGATLVQGVAPDVFVTVERDNDLFTSVAGAYGDVERVKSLNKMGTITLTLQQNSPTNDLLSGFYTADEQSSAGIFPVYVRDIGGSTMAQALRAWVNKSPNLERGGSSQTVTWTIKTDSLDIFIGGSVKKA